MNRWSGNIAIVLLVLASVATAAVSPSETNLCPYSTEIFEVSLEPGTYSVSLRGSASSWVTLSEKSFVYDGTPYPVFLTVPSGTAPGEYELVLEFKGEQNFEEHARIFVDNCFALEISVDREEIGLCKGEEVGITASLKNSGKYRETFIVRAGGENIDTIELEPGDGQNVDITLLSNMVSRKGVVLLEAIGTKSGTTTEKEISVSRDECFGFGLEVKDFIACAGEDVSVPLTIINSGTYSGKYFVTIENRLSDTRELEGEIGAGDSKTLMYTFVVPIDVRPEDYEIVVTAGNDKGSETKNVNFKVVPSDTCYDVVLEMEKEYSVKKGAGKLIKVELKNRGILAEEVSISSETEWAMIRPEQVAVDAGKSKKINLYLSPGFEVEDGEHRVIVSVRGDKTSASKEIKVNVETGKGFNPTGLISLPSLPQLGGGDIPVHLVAYFLLGLGTCILLILVALVLWVR